MAFIDFCVEHKALIFGALFAVSELLGLIPSVKSSSVFEIIYGVLKKAAGK